VFALGDGVHDDAGNTLRQPGGDALAVLPQTGNGGGRALRGRQRLGNRCIVGRRLFAGEPVSFPGQQTQTGCRPSAHQAALGNVAVRIACRMRS
jgi:hypothetical protein